LPNKQTFHMHIRMMKRLCSWISTFSCTKCLGV